MASVLLAFALTGCFGGAGDKESDGTTTRADSDMLTDLQKTLRAEGRPFNNITTGKPGDVLTNTFFDWEIKSVVAQDTITVDGEELLPGTDGYKFVLVDMRTKNVYSETNPMGSGDFSIIYGSGNDAIEDSAYEAFMDGMYPDEEQQEPGESTNGLVVFEVPQDVHEARIAYYELWDDEFEGDTYLFEITF
jgi:hypothetical protein